MSNGYYVGVPIPSLIYVGCPDKAEFDKIGAESHDHGKDANGNHVVTKSIEGAGNEPGRPVKVIFQHWLASESTDAMVARLKREREAKSAFLDRKGAKNV